MPEAEFQTVLISSWLKHQSHHKGVQRPQGEKKEKPKLSKKNYKRNSREVNILEKEASHQRAKYLKYKKLNKAFYRKKNCVIPDDPSERNFSSSS